LYLTVTKIIPFVKCIEGWMVDTQPFLLLSQWCQNPEMNVWHWHQSLQFTRSSTNCLLN